MEMPELLALAERCGFTAAAPLDPATLHFLPEVREMCAADRCHSYNRSWSCPPAAGTQAEIEARRRYTRGLLVQTVGEREDEFDFEAIQATEQRHEANFQAMTRAMRAEFADLLPMGVGACHRCERCTWPDAPCRFPELVWPPMEACGLMVSQVCRDNGLAYYYGPTAISFTSCYLF